MKKILVTPTDTGLHHVIDPYIVQHIVYYIIGLSLCIPCYTAVSTCGCGLSQQRIRCLHCGHHGASCGVCDGGGIVGVLCLSAAVSLQPLRLREHSLKSERQLLHC